MDLYDYFILIMVSGAFFCANTKFACMYADLYENTLYSKELKRYYYKMGITFVVFMIISAICLLTSVYMALNINYR